MYIIDLNTIITGQLFDKIRYKLWINFYDWWWDSMSNSLFANKTVKLTKTYCFSSFFKSIYEKQYIFVVKTRTMVIKASYNVWMIKFK